MPEILLVDDERDIRQALTAVLVSKGYSVSEAASAEEALEVAARVPPDIAVCDLALPGINGVELLTRLRRTLPNVGCVFMTAYGSIRSAVDAIRAGGDDYLTKPFDNDDLLFAVERLVKLRTLTKEVEALRHELDTRYGFTDIIGVSPGMQHVFNVMARISGLDTTVLILGESGTGKELVARGIHRRSRRAAGPFVAVNCSAIPSTLVESSFFGHDRGAFTDAKDAHAGWFEQAHGGTLFLDEVGDLPLDAQAKLLRVLQDSNVTRVGGRKPIKVDVRVVAATNKDLEVATERGTFRQDLYWRLNVVPIRLPALRQRSEDLPLLINALVERFGTELGISVTSVAADAMRLLLAHEWPGNVRELENTLRAALIMCDGPSLRATDLPSRLRGDAVGHATDPAALTMAQAVSRAVERVERGCIHAALAEHRGNRTAAADSLGVNRKTLFNKMREYGIAGDDEIGHVD